MRIGLPTRAVRLYSGIVPAAQSARADGPTARATAAAALACLAALTACGGGGGGTSNRAAPQPLPPTVSLTSPDNGATLSQNLTYTVSATANDVDGSVTQVQFFANGASIGVDTTSPYSVDWSAAPGTYDITAVATDNGGNNTTSGARSVTVVENFAPRVSFKSLTPNDVFVGPADITLGVDAGDDDGTVAEVRFLANGQEIGTATSAPFQVVWSDPDEASYTLEAIATDDMGVQTTASIPVSLVSQAPFAIDDRQMGDPDICYGNPEFTRDNLYMTWFEPLGRFEGGREVVQMWHCGIDQDTGEFIPPDCRGFAAFESNLPERAYNGMDAQGPIYVGGSNEHKFVLVRPTGPTTGEVTSIDSLADNERRAIYPSQLPNSDKIYVYWLKSRGPDITPGAAEWVELRYIDLDDPSNEIIVERQERTSAEWVPMDLTFPRWSWDEPIIIYGTTDNDGNVQIVQLDVSQPSPQPVFLTDDSALKTGQFPITYQGRRYIASSLDNGTMNMLFSEPDTGTIFDVVDAWQPPAERTFTDPCVAVSNEPFVFDGRLFTTYQVNRCGDGTDIFFSNTGEIWLTELLDGSSESWRLTQAGSDVKIEPEPLVGNDNVWVFYTRYEEGLNQNNACFRVHRAATPFTRP